jgi:hypothetical protein
MHPPPRLTAAVLDPSYSRRVAVVVAVLAQGAAPAPAPAEQAVVAVPREGPAVALAWVLEVGRGPVVQAQVRVAQVRVAEAAPALAVQVAAVQEGPVAEARAGPVGLVVMEEAIRRLVRAERGADLTAVFRAMAVGMVTVFPARVSTPCPDGRDGEQLTCVRACR